MKLKKFYISLFIISLAGLLVVQYQYLRIGLNLAKFQFNEKLKLAETDIRKGLETENQLSFLIAKGISKDEYFKLSPDSVQDASRHFLNDYVGSQLSAHNIRTEYSYRLLENDSTEYLHSPKFFEEEEAIIKYPIELEGYLPGSLGRPLILELQFQDLNSYFLSQINGLIIPSLVFLAGIVLVVIWVFRKFYLQTNVITSSNRLFFLSAIFQREFDIHSCALVGTAFDFYFPMMSLHDLLYITQPQSVSLYLMQVSAGDAVIFFKNKGFF